jgi:phenylacetate-CoA ligase
MTSPLVLADWLWLERAQRLDHEALRARQEEKLRRLVEHAWRCVPFWRRRMQAHGIDPRAVLSLDDLGRFPITTRAELQAVSLDERTSSAFAPDTLKTALTTGSTGRPLVIRRDPRFARLRHALFLRALVAGGYRPGQRIMLLAGKERKPPPAWTGWRYADGELPPEMLVERLRAVRPAALYGWVTPLRQLAEHIGTRGLDVPRARRLFTTAEAVDAVAARALACLAAERFEIYGSTELGTMAWQCRARDGYHLAAETTHLELLPVAPGSGLCRVVSTCLDLLGSPLIRYDTGDLAQAPIDGRCACGSRLPRVPRFEGRLVDCIPLADGRLLSPYKLTEAVEAAPGLARYQIVQEAVDRFTVRAQALNGVPADTASRIVEAVRAAVERPVAVEVVWERDLEPPPGQKFRVVLSRVAGRAEA